MKSKRYCGEVANMLVDQVGRDAARNLLISWAAIRSLLRYAPHE